MPFSLADITLGVVLPGTVAALIAVAGRTRCKRDWQIDLALSVALVVGFLAGYFSLSLGPVVPESHWQWIPLSLLLSLAASPWDLPRARLVHLVIALGVIQVSALFLVPTWEDLQPSRSAYLAVWTVLVWLVTWLAERQCVRGDGDVENAVRSERLACVVLGWMLLGAAILAAHSGSLRFGQIAGCGLAAVIGVGLSSVKAATAGPPRSGFLFPGILLGAATLLVAKVTSFSAVPTTSYLLMAIVPAAPQLTNWAAKSARSAPVWWAWRLAPAVAVGALALVLALVYENPWAEDAW